MFESFEQCARREALEETNLVLDNDLRFVTAENNFFMNSVPPRHYVGIYMTAHAVNDSDLKNLEPDKCEGWEWASASKILDESGIYLPQFVPLRNVLVTMGLVHS